VAEEAPDTAPDDNGRSSAAAVDDADSGDDGGLAAVEGAVRSEYPAPRLIEELEEQLGCRVVVYFGSVSEMGHGDIRPLYDLLKAIGPQKRVAVVIQSRGGNPDAAHMLLTLAHDYAEHLDVYVPTYAASAATLFALGADTLWMGPSSELSPIDPQVPVDPRLLIPTADPDGSAYMPGKPVHIPAHIIRDFLELTGVMESPYPRPKVDASRLESVMRPLNPWILGWYERADKVSRLYAKAALSGHLLRAHEPNEKKRGQLADNIITMLLDGYASHEAGILRGEVRAIGIPVSDVSEEIWTTLEKLTDEYDEILLTRNVGRILETTDGFNARAARPTRTCVDCGQRNEVDEGFRFCTACGKVLYRECIRCDQELDDTWRHCPRCGNRTGRTGDPAVAVPTV
jgi:Double zinc ribbon/Serine dehydrogenase proteinase